MWDYEIVTALKSQTLKTNGIYTIDRDDENFIQHNDYFDHNTFFQCPRCKSLNGEEYPTKKPDIDNMFKGITDALNGICYEDDKQIITVTMGKFYAEKDYTEITITEVG